MSFARFSGSTGIAGQYHGAGFGQTEQRQLLGSVASRAMNEDRCRSDQSRSVSRSIGCRPVDPAPIFGPTSRCARSTGRITGHRDELTAISICSDERLRSSRGWPHSRSQLAVVRLPKTGTVILTSDACYLPENLARTFCRVIGLTYNPTEMLNGYAYIKRIRTRRRATC